MGTVTLGLSGQVCVAQTRALVHRDVHDEFVARFDKAVQDAPVGDPFGDGQISYEGA